MEAYSEALTVSPAERVYRPATLICRGELHSRISDPIRAEADFCKAIALAEPMGAIACQLRATTGLARLRRPDAPTAGRMLGAVLDRFTDGVDTRDVREARALVGELVR